jgi:cholera toxin transcriptional activator
MPLPERHARIRFESFELDLQTRELRKNGRIIKLQDQPGKLLALLACRAGELVTREEIEKALWREDEFVEFEHAVNTAMRKIRVALADDLERPRFIETLPRKGYRFIAAVETLHVTAPQGPASTEANHADEDLQNKTPAPNRSTDEATGKPAVMGNAPPEEPSADAAASQAETSRMRAPSAEETEFRLPKPLARFLFLAVQAGYLAMYCAALYEAEAVKDVLAGVFGAPGSILAPLVLILAMCGIAVRLYLLSSVGLNHPAAGAKFRRLFPALFFLDTLWALSPLLLAQKIGYGLALGSIAPLVYLPFSQRTLMKSIYRLGNKEDGAGIGARGE